MKMPNRKRGSSVSVGQRTSLSLARRERGRKCDQRKNDHHDGYAAGPTEISDQCGGDDWRKTSAERRGQLKAGRSPAVADARTKQLREVTGLDGKHHAMTEIHRDHDRDEDQRGIPTLDQPE